jgi:hypothetical protein
MSSNVPETLAALTVPVSDLVPYGRNPRKGNVALIAESLAEHGQYRPIVVRQGTNEVLAGNHTLAAARELGWTEIAATFVDVSDDAAARIVLMDNRTSDLGTYDDRELLAILRELDEAEAGLAGTGWQTDDLDDLAALLSEAEAATPSPTPDRGGEEGENAWESTNLKEYAERYEEQGRRLVVLDYDRADYARVTAALASLREQYSEDSNSRAVLRHLTELFPDSAKAEPAA